jgi:hypothetical protein
MATMNKPAAGSPNWHRAITDNWASIEKNLLDKNLLTAKGDLFAASAAKALSALPVGADASVLLADSTQGLGMRWAALNGTGYVSVQSARATTSTNTTSTTFVDMDSMTLTVTVGASSKVLVFFNGNIEGGANWSQISLIRDTTTLHIGGAGLNSSPWSYPATLFVLDQPGAGTYTYKVQWLINSGTVTEDLQPYATTGDRMIAVVVLPG